MPVAPFACPLCAGVIQIDTDFAGQVVQCPLCMGQIALPPPEVMHAAIAGLSPTPPLNLLQLACPQCAGTFQAPGGTSGHHVGCPHCGLLVVVPPAAGSASPASEQVAPLHEPSTEPGAQRLPPLLGDSSVTQPSRPKPILVTGDAVGAGHVMIRESPLVVGSGDDQVEVRRLSIEEKRLRHFRRNVVLWTFCLVLLVVVIVYFVY